MPGSLNSVGWSFSFPDQSSFEDLSLLGYCDTVLCTSDDLDPPHHQYKKLISPVKFYSCFSN